MKNLIPYYSGNIKNSMCIGHISYERFITAHRKPKPSVVRIFKEIKKASLRKDKELKSNLKKQLFAFTPSVFIEKGKKRSYENVIRFTNFKQLDFDNIENEKIAIELKEHVFLNNPEILCSYLSPSSLGVKCLLYIKTPEDIEHFRAIHKSVETHFSCYEDYFDPCVKNAVLPLFLSQDEKILYRNLDKGVLWLKEDWSKTKYVHLNDVNAASFKKRSDKEKEYYLRKTVRIFTQKIDSIQDNGHPQVRSACLILGSRCAAGYIDRYEAETIAETSISCNKYLQKDPKNYIKTSKWAIREGMKTAKQY